MRYPSADQYCEALQHPETAILDPVLRGPIQLQTNNFGLPVPSSGGFAVTFRCEKNRKSYALRCFHRYVESLERRYAAISSALAKIRSPYFVEDFAYCPQGIRVRGNVFPVVRMTWVQGKTLGEYLAFNYRNTSKMERLAVSIRKLASHLEECGVAHGDIQPGNVVVGPDGDTLTLIDYDGMYVPALVGAGPSEDGQINFQHPQRKRQWGPILDRFSFISMWLCIKAIALQPSLWDDTQSDGDAILLRANDFRSPLSSRAFALIQQAQPLRRHAASLAAICEGAFDSIPPLERFVRDAPQVRTAQPAAGRLTHIPYESPYPVLNAADYEKCLRHTGMRVELIGRIVSVKSAVTKNGRRPYIFINFGEWQGEIVKLALWSYGLASLKEKPDESWVGRWVSCMGLLESPYKSKRYGYTHIAMSVTQSGQMTPLPVDVAHFRLGIRPDTPKATNRRQEPPKPPDGVYDNGVSIDVGARTTSSPSATIPLAVGGASGGPSSAPSSGGHGTTFTGRGNPWITRVLAAIHRLATDGTVGSIHVPAVLIILFLLLLTGIALTARPPSDPESADQHENVVVPDLPHTSNGQQTSTATSSPSQPRTTTRFPATTARNAPIKPTPPRQDLGKPVARPSPPAVPEMRPEDREDLLANVKKIRTAMDKTSEHARTLAPNTEAWSLNQGRIAIYTLQEAMLVAKLSDSVRGRRVLEEAIRLAERVSTQCETLSRSVPDANLLRRRVDEIKKEIDLVKKKAATLADADSASNEGKRVADRK